MVWPARSGFAFFLGTRLAGGVLAIELLLLCIGRAPVCCRRAAGGSRGVAPQGLEGRFFGLWSGPGIVALLRAIAAGASTSGPRVVAVATAAALAATLATATAAAVGTTAAALAAAAGGVAVDL